MKKQFIVIGLGRFGSSVARTLAGLGQEVLAVDIDEERVKQLAPVVTHAVQADTTDAGTLKSLGVGNFDVGVVAIGENLQAGILTALLLKELGVPHVVAKVANELHGQVMEKIGVDRIIYPEREMGKRLAHSLVSPSLLDYIELAEDYRIEEVVAPKSMDGKTLRELNLRNKLGISVIVIKRGEDNMIISPGAEAVVYQGDTLVIIGKNSDLSRLNRLFED